MLKDYILRQRGFTAEEIAKFKEMQGCIEDSEEYQDIVFVDNLKQCLQMSFLGYMESIGKFEEEVTDEELNTFLNYVNYPDYRYDKKLGEFIVRGSYKDTDLGYVWLHLSHKEILDFMKKRENTNLTMV